MCRQHSFRLDVICVSEALALGSSRAAAGHHRPGVGCYLWRVPRSAQAFNSSPVQPQSTLNMTAVADLCVDPIIVLHCGSFHVSLLHTVTLRILMGLNETSVRNNGIFSSPEFFL